MQETGAACLDCHQPNDGPEAYDSGLAQSTSSPAGNRPLLMVTATRTDLKGIGGISRWRSLQTPDP